MHTKLIIALVLIVGAVAVWVGVMHQGDERIETEEATGPTKEPPLFSWRFEEAGTLNPDGNSQTEVLLTVTYPDGAVNEQRVDTVDGDCNVLADEDHAVQCYYAGLGQRYRITEEDGSFVVERKYFEEALPDIEPPEQEWEVVAVIVQ